MTHGLLIDWYISASKESRRVRYLYTASHHANISARLCRLISPKGAPSSPAVLNFMTSVFEPCSKQAPELYYFYKDAVRAMQERVEQMRSGGEKLHVKRMKQPNRYRCATPGCGIEADTGAKLSQCVYDFHLSLQHIYNLYQVVDPVTSTKNLTTAAKNVKNPTGRTTSHFAALVQSARSSTLVTPILWRSRVQSQNQASSACRCRCQTGPRNT